MLKQWLTLTAIGMAFGAAKGWNAFVGRSITQPVSITDGE